MRRLYNSHGRIWARNDGGTDDGGRRNGEGFLDPRTKPLYRRALLWVMYGECGSQKGLFIWVVERWLGRGELLFPPQGLS